MEENQILPGFFYWQLDVGHVYAFRDQFVEFVITGGLYGADDQTVGPVPPDGQGDPLAIEGGCAARGLT